MGLMLNVDPSIIRGEEIQYFEIEHNGELLKVKLYRRTGKLKMVFDGPKSFRVHRYKKPTTPLTE